MKRARLVIVGGGFAGIWATAAAASLRHGQGAESALAISLISDSGVMTMRPHLYKQNLEDVTVPLADITSELGAELIVDEVADVDAAARRLRLRDGGTVGYDCAVLAVGSRVYKPPIPGLDEFAHDIDTLAGAARFWGAFEAAIAAGTEPVVAVIGAGFTGIELATEIGARAGCVLIDSTGAGFEQMAGSGADTINEALDTGRIRRRFGERVQEIDERGVTLADGSRVEAALVVWTAGMRAHPLTECLASERDVLGRLRTDEYLAVEGVQAVYAAGDAALFRPDGTHEAPMSCQFAIPSGMFAGHNAAAQLLETERHPFRRDQYVTCVDLGSSGALLTEGWARVPSLTGMEAKGAKRSILEIIRPPSNRDALFAAADLTRMRTLRIA